MQSILAIPELMDAPNPCEASKVLMREVASVPLLTRIIATAVRADVDSVLVIWPEDLDDSILASVARAPEIKNVRIDKVAWPGPFDPRNMAHWEALAPHVHEEFLWLPWNWVTHKRALSELATMAVLPVSWQRPARLDKSALLRGARFRITSLPKTQGVSVTTAASVRLAERFLAANSGKPTDGIYSNFNRALCRPSVRILSRTRVTPNGLTLVGLAVALAGAVFFAQGSYASAVIGALLFFVSGLFDEMDGMIARIKFKESAFGTWFEGFVDNVTYLAVFVGIMIGLYHRHGNWALKYGIALIGGSILSVAAIALQRKAATSRDKPHEYAAKMNRLMDADSANLVSKVVRQIHIFVKKGVLVHYLLLFTVLGGLPVFLWLAALGSNLTWIIALYFTYRFFRRTAVSASAPKIQPAA